GKTKFGNATINYVRQLRASGERFYGLFGTDDGNATVVAEYRDGRWVALMDPFTIMPTGATRSGFYLMDAGRDGSIAVAGGGSVQGVGAFVRRPDGSIVQVLYSTDFSVTGTQIRGFNDINIRDDGTV